MKIYNLAFHHFLEMFYYKSLKYLINSFFKTFNPKEFDQIFFIPFLKNSHLAYFLSFSLSLSLVLILLSILVFSPQSTTAKICFSRELFSLSLFQSVSHSVMINYINYVNYAKSNPTVKAS